MTRLILIRHGETDWNVEGRWQGQADVPLNERGRRQAVALAEALRSVPIDALYSSDLARACLTAHEIGRVKGLPVRVDPRLREIHQGEWQGLLVREIEARYAGLFAERRRNPLSVAPPGGETVAEAKRRVIQVLEEVAQEHPHETVLIVSHGFALALALVHFRSRPVEEVWDMVPENGQPVVLEVSAAKVAKTSE